MSILISILIVIASIVLVLIVLVQNSKGGGLASNFSSSNQIMGVRKTTDFLEKATWTLIGSIVVLCIVATSIYTGSEQVTSRSEVASQVEAPVAPVAAPEAAPVAPVVPTAEEATPTAE